MCGFIVFLVVEVVGEIVMGNCFCNIVGVFEWIDDGVCDDEGEEEVQVQCQYIYGQYVDLCFVVVVFGVSVGLFYVFLLECCQCCYVGYLFFMCREKIVFELLGCIEVIVVGYLLVDLFYQWEQFFVFVVGGCQ